MEEKILLKKKLNSFFQKKYLDICIALSVGIVAFLIVYIFCGFAKYGLKIPYAYAGGDEFSELVSTKLLGEQLWTWFNPRIAAPNGNYSFGFLANMLNGFDLLLAKFFYLFTDNFVVVFNLRFLVVFPLASILSYVVFRVLKLNPVFSAFGGIVYSLTPYVFFRNVMHLSLVTCYFVPLSVLLCVWATCGSGECLKFQKGFIKSKKNWLIILFCALIANNGIGYYAFFTCFFLCVVAVCNWFETKKITSIVVSVKMICGILFFSVVAIAPALIYKLAVGGTAVVTVRGGADAELYSLKIIQLFIPTNGHNIDILEKFISYYNGVMPLVNENQGAYLGIAGICGFIISIILLFKTKRKDYESFIVSVLVRMNVFAVLFATIGGFSSIFGMIFPFLRGFNRISIFISFISLCILLITAQNVFEKTKNMLKWKKIAAISFCVLFGSVCVWDLLPTYGNHDWAFDMYGKEFSSDSAFVAKIEDELGEEAMVFQLPYHKCPEAGSVNKMNDYHLYAGFLHSDTLKWSYGGTKGGDGDLWCRYVSSLYADEMIELIAKGGFTGIYIDARAYTPEELATLRVEIETVVKISPLISDNGNLLFYNLNNYIETNRITVDKGVYDIAKTRANYRANNLYVSEGGKAEINKIIISGSCTQFGPYCDVEKGKYLIAFYGENLMNAELGVSCEFGVRKFSYEIVSESDGIVVLKTEFPESLTGVEFTTHNPTEQEIIVNSVKTIRIENENDIQSAVSELTK